MKYLSTYYRAQGGKVPTSLVLQQMQYEKFACPMLFGCLCAQDAMADELLVWIGRKKSDSRQRIVQTLDGWGRELEQLLERWTRILQERDKKLGVEAGSVDRKADLIGKKAGSTDRKADSIDKNVQPACDVSGVICIGNEFLMFYHGDARFYIINTRFGKNHVKAVSLAGAQGVIRGSLEKGVGILMPNSNFMSGISERQLQEVLNVQELKVEAQLECRLYELGKLGQKHDLQESERWNEERNVSQGSAAIFLVTQ